MERRRARLQRLARFCPGSSRSRPRRSGRFRSDNGTERFVHVSAQGQPASDAFMRRWLSQVPSDIAGPPRGDVCHAQSRYRRVLVLVRWRTGLQLLIRQLGVRDLHLAHGPRHVRQGRDRRCAKQCDRPGDAGLFGVGGSDASATRRSPKSFDSLPRAGTTFALGHAGCACRQHKVRWASNGGLLGSGGECENMTIGDGGRSCKPPPFPTSRTATGFGSVVYVMRSRAQRTVCSPP